MGELPAVQETTQQQSTWLQTTCGSCPAHDRRYSAHHCSHPGVDDAEPLERCVAARVEKDVEGTQEARQGVYRQREQRDSRNAAGQSKGHCVKGTDLSSDEWTVLCAVHVGVKGHLK